jgi:hypothetical protein
MLKIVIVTLLYLRHRPVDNIKLLGSWRKSNVFPNKFPNKPIELSFKQKTERWIMSRMVIAISICHRRKPVDLIRKRCT